MCNPYKTGVIYPVVFRDTVQVVQGLMTIMLTYFEMDEGLENSISRRAH